MPHATTWLHRSRSGNNPLSRDSGYLATGVSAAGIPLYPPGSNNVNYSALNRQDSGTALDTEIAAPPMITSESQLITPVESMATPGQVFDQVDAANSGVTPYDYQTQAPAYFDAPPPGTPASAAAVDSTNAAIEEGIAAFDRDSPIGPGLEYGDYPTPEFNGQFDISGSVSNARDYFTFDLQYMDRLDGDIQLTNFGGLTNWGEGYGARLTYGRRQDATRGREFSYWGTSEIDASNQRFSEDGNLNPLFITDPIFDGDETSPFFNAVEQFEQKSTYFHSVEFNRVKWGWDVVKSFIGLRVLYLDDQYGLFSENLDGETGTLTLDAQNILIGPHIGRELFYDVGFRWSLSAFFKAGVYVNVSEFEINAAKLGVPFIDVDSNDTTIAGTLELGLLAHYELTNRARMRFGYNVLYFGNVSTVSDNLPPVISPFTGNNINDSDHATFQGLFVGLEFFR